VEQWSLSHRRTVAVHGGWTALRLDLFLDGEKPATNYTTTSLLILFSFFCSTPVVSRSPVIIPVIDMIIRKMQICGAGYWL
jgi:hypothetical protein